jgi:fatty acid desaturase
MNLRELDYPAEGATKAFLDWHGPTAVLALFIYSAWISLVLFHNELPWYLLFPVAGYLTALHTSLQHETIHAVHKWPRWLQALVSFPPLGLVFPYPHYKKLHIIHHRDARVTDPLDDPESYYVTPDQWQLAGPLGRAYLYANNTLAGRMILGPVMTVVVLIAQELPKILRVEAQTLKIWLVHAALIAVLFWFVEGVAGMAFWKYILFFAWPGLMLTLLRSFAEHRSADKSGERTAIVESGPFMGLLFLNNNIHVVHHLRPAMPWYQIPGFYRKNRKELLAANGGYFLKGYGEIIAKYLFKPVMHPVHPGY